MLKPLQKNMVHQLIVIHIKKLKENILNFKKNFKSISPLICFAVKSNTNIKLN